MQAFKLSHLPIYTQHAFQYVCESIESLKERIKYCEEAINSDIENWERKEYVGVLEDNKKELAEKEQHLQKLIKMYPEVVID